MTLVDVLEADLDVVATLTTADHTLLAPSAPIAGLGHGVSIEHGAVPTGPLVVLEGDGGFDDDLAEAFDAAAHPRAGAGSSTGGQFVSASSQGSSSSGEQGKKKPEDDAKKLSGTAAYDAANEWVYSYLDEHRRRQGRRHLPRAPAQRQRRRRRLRRPLQRRHHVGRHGARHADGAGPDRRPRAQGPPAGLQARQGPQAPEPQDAQGPRGDRRRPQRHQPRRHLRPADAPRRQPRGQAPPAAAPPGLLGVERLQRQAPARPRRQPDRRAVHQGRRQRPRRPGRPAAPEGQAHRRLHPRLPAPQRPAGGRRHRPSDRPHPARAQGQARRRCPDRQAEPRAGPPGQALAPA